MLIARKSLPWRISSVLAVSSTANCSSYLSMARSTYILGACESDRNFCCQKTWKYVKQEIRLKLRIFRRRRLGSGPDDLKRANGYWFVGSWGTNSLECLVCYFSTSNIHWHNRPFYKLYKLEWDIFGRGQGHRHGRLNLPRICLFLILIHEKYIYLHEKNIDLQCDIPLDPPKGNVHWQLCHLFRPGGRRIRETAQFCGWMPRPYKKCNPLPFLTKKRPLAGILGLPYSLG